MAVMSNGKYWIINRGLIMELKDKLNLVWKFLFLAVFTYGVISMTCCKDSCSSASKSSCCKTEDMATKPCSSGK